MQFAGSLPTACYNAASSNTMISMFYFFVKYTQFLLSTSLECNPCKSHLGMLWKKNHSCRFVKATG